MSKSKKLAYKVFVPDKDGEMQSFGPGDDVPGWAAKQITNPSAWGDEAEETKFGPGGIVPAPGESTGADDTEGDEDPDGEIDYSKLKKDELEAEVAKRNEARDDDVIEVGGTGTKADLAAALEADDTEGDED